MTMEETMMELLPTYLTSMGLSLIFSIVCYVFTSLSYYTIAKRRGINKPWLAWIPIGNVWITGSLSDQYRYVVKGQVTNKRKVLLGLETGLYIVLAVFIGMYVSLLGTLITGLNGTMTDAVEMQLMSQALTMLGVCLVMLVVAIVYTVFFYIAVYDVFRSCDPGNSTMYLVLSILVGVVYPFFLFACRNKDDGMPPRTNVDPVAMPLE